MRKLRPARKADNNLLGAEPFRILSQTRQTRYDEELAAIAGSNHVSTEKIIRSPLRPCKKCTIF